MSEKFEPKPGEPVKKIEAENGEEITLRNAAPEDADTIIEIQKDRERVRAKKGRKPRELTEEDRIKWVEEIERARRGESVIIIAEIDGRAQGYANIGIPKDSSDKKARIFSIAVSETARKRGLGTELLKEGIVWAKNLLGAESIQGRIDIDNLDRDSVVKMNQRCGLEEVSRDEKHIIMEKLL